jgi:3-hydroxybutyryl-CoA dehydratase
MTPIPTRVGDALPALTKTVTQDQISAYADAARDWNPIHVDAAFATTTQFGTRIAHGMLGLGFISQMMSTAFPETWAPGGSLKVRFKAPVFPGETVNTYGEITKIEELGGRPVATCKIGCIKPDGTEAISGTALVPLEKYAATGSSTTAGRRGD